jgi:hypothetical protein
MGPFQLKVTANHGLSNIWLPARLVLSLIAIVAALSPGRAIGQEFVPFVIPARIDSKYPIWISRYESISPTSPRIAVRNAHFARGETSVRVWGVNLSFAANFPTHEDANAVATRLAAAGVNSVRCHHMDTSPWPNGIWNPQNKRTLSPEALDRLDYFINELAKRGIFVNINLHVGRAHSEYLNLPKPNREYDKMVGIFTPALIEAQKTYARDLLTHLNPYRNARYADDAAVAFVEISNEDSLFMWDADETLRTLPPYYSQILRDQFNAWLQKRYGSDEALRTAWAKETRPLGENMLKNSDLSAWDAGQGIPSSWNLEQHEGCQATLSKLQSAQVRVQIAKADGTDWHLQFNQRGLTLKQGQYYTVSFEAASDQPRQIACTVGQAHDPWNNLGLSRPLDLTTGSKRFSLGFVATADDSNARVSLAFGGNPTSFVLSHIELRPGGQVGLAGGESLKDKSIALFQENESQQRILDRMMFLAETEKAYFDGMRSYVQKDLGCGALVAGTVVFGPLGLYAQSDMDYIDAHAYWQHPRFPNKPWDAADWFVEQWPMTDHLKGATLSELVAERLAGKPYTVSEYNHPAPLDAQAECVPMIASFAARQGWDGVWLYTYSHSNDNWSREYLNSYFDIDTNPAKWGFMRAGAAMFVENRQPVTTSSIGIPVTGADDAMPKAAHLHLQNDRDMFAILVKAWQYPITGDSILRKTFLPSYAGKALMASNIDTPGVETSWSTDGVEHGLYQVAGPLAKVYTGHAERMEKETRGEIQITSPEFVALTITSLDGNANQRVLITACGRCENTGMKFSADRRTVGRNWGQAPVRIEAVSGRIVLPQGRWTCQALAPDGSPKQEVPITYEEQKGILVLSPQYGTMWYLLERQRP